MLRHIEVVNDEELVDKNAAESSKVSSRLSKQKRIFKRCYKR